MSAPNPLWTKARLTRVLQLNFGGEHELDVDAVATAMGVTGRTVQRWLGAGHGRSLAKIPAKRLDQLAQMLRPNQDLYDNEELEGNYAEEAIHRIGLGREKGILDAWRKQRWLEPHLMVILRLRRYGQTFYQAAITRADTKLMGRMKRRGEIFELIQVPTKFHATAIQHALLVEIDAWRFRASSIHVPQGFTKCWFDDAPPVSLTRIERELETERKATLQQRYARKPARHTVRYDVDQEGTTDER